MTKKPEDLPMQANRPQDACLVENIVQENLGQDFNSEYGTWPQNVGIKGDERHYGDTVLITTTADTPAQAFWEHYQVEGGGLTPDTNHPEVAELQKVVSEITSRTNASKVLIDVTPKNIEPKYRQQPIEPNEVTTLKELVEFRIQTYPLLTQKFWDTLDDPMMCAAVLAIINVKDAAFRQRQARAEAARLRHQ